MYTDLCVCLCIHTHTHTHTHVCIYLMYIYTVHILRSTPSCSTASTSGGASASNASSSSRPSFSSSAAASADCFRTSDPVQGALAQPMTAPPSANPRAGSAAFATRPCPKGSPAYGRAPNESTSSCMALNATRTGPPSLRSARRRIAPSSARAISGRNLLPEVPCTQCDGKCPPACAKLQWSCGW